MKDIEKFSIPQQKLNSFREDYISRIAEAYGREISTFSSFQGETGDHPDSEISSVPPYIGRILSSPFQDSVKELNRDVLAKFDFDSSGEEARVLKEAVNSLSNVFIQDLLSEDNSTLLKARAALSLRELQKAQQLVGAPKLHTPLSLGGHFVYEDIPSGFSKHDWSWVSDAGRWFKEFTDLKRKPDYTLPLMTSQGLLLKGEKETTQIRVFAKALLSSIALDLGNMHAYRDWTEDFGNLFHKYGYDNIASSFYLGIRRQQARKSEPVTDPNSGEVIGQSMAYQGRIRGIFPAPEQIKVILKPLSEGLKKALFTKTSSCSVNTVDIARSLWDITYRTLDNGLFVLEEEDLGVKVQVRKWLTFYDLGQFDTTQHEGWFLQVYLPFLRSAFDNFDDLEYPMTYFSDFLFPEGTRGRNVIKQQVLARSTMSGQPDVTVKNNVVHLIAMSKAISMITGDKPLDTFKKIVTGDSIIAKVHGDDTMLWFSNKSEDYLSYKENMESFGLKIDFEMGPVYLKKTIPFLSCADGSYFRKGMDALSKINKEDPSAASQLLYGKNKKLAPVIGSILKNRHGEYPIPFTLLLKMSLLDTYALLDGEPEFDDCLRSYWNLLWDIQGQTSSDLKISGAYVFSLDSDKDDFLNLKKIIVRQVLELTSSNSEMATAARDYLERIYYSNLQDDEFLNDEDMIAIYGALEYNPVQEAEEFGLQSLTLEQKTLMAKTLQEYLIQNDGSWPVFDAIQDLKHRIQSNKFNSLSNGAVSFKL